MTSNGQRIGLALAMLAAQDAWACSVIAAGRDASASGRPLVAHTDDGGPEPNDIRLVKVPAKSWDPAVDARPLQVWISHYPRLVDADRAPDYAPADESQLPSEVIARIPQVEQTFGYWDLNYAVQNDQGLSMAESTCSARTAGWPASAGSPHGHCHAGIEDLGKLGMERCSSARCAVELMGRIAVEQGFYAADSGDPASPDYGDSSESMVVADEQDLWIFNVMTGRGNASAIWAAQRVDPGHVVAIANTFTIRQINLHDPDNFLYSPDVTALAEEMGWWKPEDDEPGFFSWSRTYGYLYPGLGGEFLAGRRMWRIYSRLSGAELDPEKGEAPLTEDPYPASFPVPQGSVTPQRIMSVYRDHYEGTPYDLTVGMAAGPFGTPNRAGAPKGVVGHWERAISPRQTSWSYVAEASTEFFGSGVVWYGQSVPHSTAYLPLLGVAADPPDSYSKTASCQSKFSFDSAWWAFHFVETFSDLNFKLINADVREKALDIEQNASRALAACEARARLSDAPAVNATQCLNRFVEDAVRTWWDFGFSLVGKYARYMVTENETSFEPQLYPEWWLNSQDVGFTTWKKGGPFHGEVCPVLATQEPVLKLAMIEVAGAEGGASVVSVACLVSAVALVAGALGYRAGVRRGTADIREPSRDYAHFVA